MQVASITLPRKAATLAQKLAQEQGLRIVEQEQGLIALKGMRIRIERRQGPFSDAEWEMIRESARGKTLQLSDRVVLAADEPNLVPLGVSIAAPYYRLLDNLAKELRLTKRSIIEQALAGWAEGNGFHIPNRVASQTRRARKREQRRADAG